jgi:hypothetical protein
MKIVNGYACQTSCDVTAAKRGLDPRNPHDDPVKQAQLDAAKVCRRSGRMRWARCSSAARSKHWRAGAAAMWRRWRACSI